jgi:hypothetical protein
MEEIMKIMEAVKVSDSKTIGKIMASRGRYKEGNSAIINSHKKLMEGVEARRLEKIPKAFRVVGCKSEWKEHAQLITSALAEIIINYPDSIIYREHQIQEVGLRPDAVCLIIKENLARCIILEIMNTETEKYLQQKINTWQQWPNALEYLSNLFGYRIPHYEIKEVQCEHLQSQLRF